MAFVREGTDADVTVERQVAMRYKGQGWEIPVRLGDAPSTTWLLSSSAPRFTKAYEEFFGRAIDDLAIEAVSWSVRVASVVDAPTPVELSTNGTEVTAPNHRTMYDPIGGVDAGAAVVERTSLSAR